MFNKILKIAEANAKIDALKAEVCSFEEQLEASKKHLADADDYGQSLRGDLAEQDIKIKFLENEIDRYKKAICEQHEQIDYLKDRISMLENENGKGNKYNN